MIRIQVPATTANMGPGFDCVGMALGLYNYVEVEEIEKGLEIEILDEDLKGHIPQDETNLVYDSMLKVFKKVNKFPSGVRIRQKSNVPPSRGLGSSSTCIVAGVIAANKLIGNPLTEDELLNLAIEIEGHPDNVAPAMLGGMVASIKTDQGYICEKIDVSEDVDFYTLIPDFKLETKKAREVLPDCYSRQDAIFNIGRGMLLIKAFMDKDFSKLSQIFEDRMHQNYRMPLIPFMKEAFEYCLLKGARGVYLSGAGPTIMAVVTGEDSFEKSIQEFYKINNLNWSLLKLKCDINGALKSNGGL